ncbi:CPBP family intramembrane glutamic endopeptidase [Ensifer canadensis]
MGLSLVTGAAVYLVVPRLLARGWSGPYAALVPIGACFILMFAITFVGLRREGGTQPWRERLRLTKPSGADIAGGMVIGLSMIFSVVVIEGHVQEYIMAVVPMRPPQWFLDIMKTSGTVFGAPGLGRWDFLALHLALFALNIFGEELLFRGYLLPRQESVGYRYAWVLNGIQWTAFHWFWFHILPMILPTSLLLSWITLRRKSTWCAIIGHGMLNALAVIGTFLTVSGLKG